MNARHRVIDSLMSDVCKQVAKQAVLGSSVSLSSEDKWEVLNRVEELICDGYSESQIKEVIDFKIRKNRKHPLAVLSNKFHQMIDETWIGVCMEEDKISYNNRLSTPARGYSEDDWADMSISERLEHL